ncbi:lytic transglycosylase domain-containing protein [Klebsiella sp. WP3-W18-ESBL-02]|uniref:lytic transglycosylase domain-containing protein n=1 Tax=unclassified Klebsiella TaxID=2608929 RepID=UPI0015DC40CD|nr:lytic transglycosylase [Klebsiella sp. WP3-W18-ESBL-02]BBR23772.1 lytic transglycosylase [Klebsiella sp. WP3-S18-ESBL-05]
MKINLLAPLLLAIVLPASATSQMCFDQAGKDYNIDPLLLMSISIQESRLIATATNSANRDGTEDVCGMQINSSHYEKLAGFNITRKRLMNDPCICVYTGAWVLAHNFRSYGKNWDSVGIYNTGPSKKLIVKRREYADKIKSIYRILQARKILIDKQTTEKTAAVLQTDSMTEPKITQ